MCEREREKVWIFEERSKDREKERVGKLGGTRGVVARQGQTGHDRENDAGARRCAFLARYVVVLRDNEKNRPRARDT